MILESVENGPLLWPTVKENRVTRPKKYSELSETEAIQADYDVKATNIILQGLPLEVYALVSTHKVTKELWERIQMLMQGTSLTKQERECKLYDEFDKFAYKKRESLRDFYLRFSLLLNDMNIYNMKLENFQVNRKFLNTLLPEWSKFVTDVKLVRDLHITNVDQLHAYLGQHEYHANEYETPHHSSQYASQVQSSTPLSITYTSNDFQSSVNHNVYNPPSSIPQVEYAPSVHQQSNFSQPDTGLVVPVFQKGDDPIDAINHMMSFLTAVVTSRYPPTNNQLRNSFNPRQQATINNRRVTIQPIQGTSNAFQLSVNHNVYNPSSSIPQVEYAPSVHQQSNFSQLDTGLVVPVFQKDNTHPDQVELIQGNKGSLFVTTVREKAIGQSSAQSQRGKEMRRSLRIRSRDSRDSKHIIALMANLSHYGFDNLAEKEESRNIDRELALEKQKTDAIMIRDSEETLMLEEESRSKMLQKQKDPMMSKKKVNTKPVDYAALNQLSQDFKTRFVPQTELSAEQAFWSQNSGNSEEPNLSTSTTIVEVPKELPKVSIVNSSLKKLKFHLASFDMVVKERTTTTAITEVQNVFTQMEQAVEQHCVEKNKFQDKMKDVLKENERLLEQAISTDIVNIIVNANMNYA
nr:hypothetical protein [Tanacetum cinerariifolium]